MSENAKSRASLKALLLTDFMMASGLGRNEDTAIALRVLALTCEHPRGKYSGLDIRPEELMEIEARARFEQTRAKTEFFTKEAASNV